MDHVIRLVGPTHAVEILGVKLLGFNAENVRKLFFTLFFVATMLLLARALSAFSGWVLPRRRHERVVFWTRQGIRITCAGLLLVGLVSIWFDQPARLATAAGLMTAGLAFALQKVVTALAGYLVILRGKTFNVGDRITMGGVRGDVIALGFIQTRIMEMGQPPPVQSAAPAMWVQSREYTGRIVTVTNDKIFDQPVYNYTREFPYIWEELALPLPYTADSEVAERILLAAAERHTVGLQDLSEEALAELERRYALKRGDVRPHVYFRLTDNWLELTVRFVVEEHGVRAVKDRMSRDILRDLTGAGIGVASATFEVTGLPPLRVAADGGRPAAAGASGARR